MIDWIERYFLLLGGAILGIVAGYYMCWYDYNKRGGEDD